MGTNLWSWIGAKCSDCCGKWMLRGAVKERMSSNNAMMNMIRTWLVEWESIKYGLKRVEYEIQLFMEVT